MSLAPQVAGLLAAMHSQPKPDFTHLTAVQLRQAYDRARLPAALVPAVQTTFERHIDGPHSPIILRIYQPEASMPLPVLVYFHGGGFVLGNLDSHDNLCRALSNVLPAVVVAVEYRLAPEHKFPAGLDDAFAAVEWVAHNAHSLGGDPALLVVGGDSAGGNLAAVVCQQARDAGGPAIAHQLLFYPVCDDDLHRPSYHENGIGYFLETEMMVWFWRQYLNSPDEGTLAKVCPLKGSVTGLPSATVVTVEYDPLRDEGEAYARKMAQAGVAVEHIQVAGAIHGYLNFVGMLTLADQTVRQIAARVNKALGT